MSSYKICWFLCFLTVCLFFSYSFFGEPLWLHGIDNKEKCFYLDNKTTTVQCQNFSNLDNNVYKETMHIKVCLFIKIIFMLILFTVEMKHLDLKTTTNSHHIFYKTNEADQFNVIGGWLSLQSAGSLKICNQIECCGI